MKVDFAFKHVDTSEALMSYARDRLDRIERFELNPMDVHFTISMVRHECTVDVSVLEGRRKFKASATTDDFYRAVEMVINKLWRQMSRDKRRIKGHKRPEQTAEGKLAAMNDQLEYNFQPNFRKVG